LTRRNTLKALNSASPASQLSSSLSTTPDLAFLGTLQFLHELHLERPHQDHSRLTAFAIANAARSDPILSEVLNISLLVAQPRKMLSDAYEKDFKKSTAISDVFKIVENEGGSAKFLSIRGGLAEIRRKDSYIYFFRPEKTAKSLKMFPILSSLICSKFAEFDSYTQISRLAMVFKGVAMLLSLDETTQRLVKDRAFVSLSGERYRDFGLLISGPKIGGIRMTPEEYAKETGMNQAELEEFNNLLNELT
jgi:hypothetical protein